MYDMLRKEHWEGRVLVTNRHCPAAPLPDFLREAWDLSHAGTGLFVSAAGTQAATLPPSRVAALRWDQPWPTPEALAPWLTLVKPAFLVLPSPRYPETPLLSDQALRRHRTPDPKTLEGLERLRQLHRPMLLDRTCRQIHTLCRAFSGLAIAVELSASWLSAADQEFFALLGSDLASLPVGYWHDAAQAMMREKSGRTPQLDLVEDLGKYLLGTHLSDAFEDQDGLACGIGQVPFPALRKLLPSSAVSLLVLAPGTPAPVLVQSLAFLKQAGWRD